MPLIRAFTLWTLCLTGLPVSAQTDPLDVWHQRLNPSGSNPTGIAYGNGTFVAVGNGGFLLVSPDGTTWTQYISPPVINYGGVIFANGWFYAYGSLPSSLTNCILRSPDGVAWTKIYESVLSSGASLRSAAYGNNKLVFVGSDRIITATLTSTNWSEFQLPGSTPLSGVTYGMGRFVSCGRSGSSGNAYVLSSLDGIVWRYDYGPKIDLASSSIAYGNGLFVASWRTNSATDSGFLVSSNLTTWNYVPVTGIGAQTVSAVCFGGGQFIAALGGSYTSSDGSSWTNRAAAAGGNAYAYGLGTFVTSLLRQSDVFASSTSSPPSNLALSLYAGVSVTGTEGQTYRIESTTNVVPGAIWSPLTNFTLPYSPFLWIDTTAPGQPRRFYRAVEIQ